MRPNQGHFIRAAFVGFLCLLTFGGCQRGGGTAAVKTTRKDGPLFPVSKDNKDGYINSDGKVVIDIQFDKASNFSEGLAAVCLGPCKFVQNKPLDDPLDQTFQGAYGFIDPQGKMVINPHFTVVGDFHHSLAYASTDEYKMSKSSHKYGYIDKSGAFVIPEQFDEQETLTSMEWQQWVSVTQLKASGDLSTRRVSS